jgi:UDP-N-acetyl-D-mannosaminuronate dehydrogenase
MATTIEGFEFQEPGYQEYSDALEENLTDFGEMSEEFKDKSDVIIFTKKHRIYGQIALVQGARLTDYIVDAKPFIAVTEAEIRDHAGDLIFKTQFLDINRDHIEFILPAELAKTD